MYAIRSYYDYQPKNAILIITGDIEPKAAFEGAKKHFESIPNTREIPEFKFKEPRQDRNNFV